MLQLIHKFTFSETTSEENSGINNNNKEDTQTSILEQLERLAMLKEKGFLTDEEFLTAKAKFTGLTCL